MSSVNSNPKDLLNQLTMALGTSGSYNKYMLATAVTPQGTSVFKINDLKDMRIVTKHGSKMLRCKVSNNDLKTDGKNYSKKAKELKEQTQSLATITFSLVDKIGDICVPFLETQICFPLYVPKPIPLAVENLPAISDGWIGFEPIKTPQENGWHRASPTGMGWFVWVQTRVRNGGFVTASWNEARRILRVWCKGGASSEGDGIVGINDKYQWNLWEAMIPSSTPGAAALVSKDEDMFNGNGNQTQNGYIEFRNCSGNLCITAGSAICYLEKGAVDRTDEYTCQGPRPNWLRMVPTNGGIGQFTPCSTKYNVQTCYL